VTQVDIVIADGTVREHYKRYLSTSTGHPNHPGKRRKHAITTVKPEFVWEKSVTFSVPADTPLNEMMAYMAPLLGYDFVEDVNGFELVSDVILFNPECLDANKFFMVKKCLGHTAGVLVTEDWVDQQVLTMQLLTRPSVAHRLVIAAFFNQRRICEKLSNEYSYPSFITSIDENDDASSVLARVTNHTNELGISFRKALIYESETRLEYPLPTDDPQKLLPLFSRDSNPSIRLIINSVDDTVR
jgi:hypothetical protein